MVSILFIMLAGGVTGYLLSHRQTLIRLSERLLTWAIYLLLLLLGISVGMNKLILSHFDRIGWQAVVITIFSVAGSVLVSAIIYKIFFRLK